MDRSDVLNRIGQARSTQGSQGGPSDGKGVMIKQTSIGTHPFFSKTPIEQLQKGMPFCILYEPLLSFTS